MKVPVGSDAVGVVLKVVGGCVGVGSVVVGDVLVVDDDGDGFGLFVGVFLALALGTGLPGSRVRRLPAQLLAGWRRLPVGLLLLNRGCCTAHRNSSCGDLGWTS